MIGPLDIPALSGQDDMGVNPESLFEQVELLRGQLRDQSVVIDRQTEILRGLNEVLGTIESDDGNINVEKDPVTGRITMSIPALDDIVEAAQGLESAAQTFPAHITGWESATSDYTWGEVRRNAADTDWETWANNRNSTDYNNARHVDGIANLPTTLFAIMRLTTDADGEIQPFFTVPAEDGGTRDTTVNTSPEGAEAADTGTWDIEAQPSGKKGFTLTLTGRVGYFESGDQTLYGYARTLTFDVMGRVMSVSAETQYTIDVPEACP